jgi:hypothetical protein
MTDELTVQKLKAERYDMEYKRAQLELRVVNITEAIELTSDRIDRIEMKEVN